MMPSYGCSIWNMLFEPFDDALVQAVIAEATNIVNSDSRLVLQNMTVKEFNQGLLLQITLLYQPYGVINGFTVEFDRRAVALDAVG